MESGGTIGHAQWQLSPFASAVIKLAAPKEIFMKTWNNLIIASLIFILSGCATTHSSSTSSNAAGMDLDAVIKDAAMQMVILSYMPSG
jgi:uncharacterized lipoprotein YajG